MPPPPALGWLGAAQEAGSGHQAHPPCGHLRPLRRGMGHLEFRGQEEGRGTSRNERRAHASHVLRTQGCPPEPACQPRHPSAIQGQGRCWLTQKCPSLGPPRSTWGEGGRAASGGRDVEYGTHRGDNHGAGGDPRGCCVGLLLPRKRLVRPARPGRAERSCCREEAGGGFRGASRRDWSGE